MDTSTYSSIFSRVTATLVRRGVEYHSAQDFAQDALIAFCTADPPVAVQSSDDVMKWVTTVAKRRSIEAWRRGNILPMEADSDPILGVIEAREPLEAEVVDCTGISLAGLSAREREILDLRYSQDLTLTEIGERLGLTQSGASLALNRILQRLRDRAGAADIVPAMVVSDVA